MSNSKEKQFIDAAKAGLEQQADELSPEIRRQLSQARKQALQGAAKQPVKSYWQGLLPAAGWSSAVAAAVVAVIVILPSGTTPRTPAIELEQLSFETLEMLSAEDDLELYENLEFIAWLATEPAQG